MQQSCQPVPSHLGYRIPAEWEPHEATWMAWPHNRDDWPGKFQTIPWVVAEVIRHLHRGELIYLLAAGGDQAQARDVLSKAGVDLQRIRFFDVPTDRIWTRDYGPIFLTGPDGGVGYTDWRFNAWAKYDDWQLDDSVTDTISAGLNGPRWRPEYSGTRVVLEGGSIDVNGSGLLLTTEECLLSSIQQRNPGMERADYEKVFADYLGIRKVIWVGRGIAGDDTHGHVDDIARFVGPKTIVTVVEDDPNDVNFAPLQENWQRLQTCTDLEGSPLTIVSLPMPAPVVFQGQRLPASYANFYIGNECVLVPTFNDPKDRIALGIIADQFPDRRIVGIHAIDLVWGLGTLHCMTQQQPAHVAD